MSNWIDADWPAPDNIFAISTLRTGGVSKEPFMSFNLADHVEDDRSAVLENRTRLKNALNLPSEPVWLQQIHSDKVACVDEDSGSLKVDAAFTVNPNIVCAVLTADCLPILLCNQSGTKIAAIHAGWRGLLSGVIQNTILALQDSNLMAWLGPAIGEASFEVGNEVRDAFCHNSEVFFEAFQVAGKDKWLADIYHLSRIILTSLGVKKIYGGGFCTVTEKERFFSYRRDGKTGRMASLIWRN